MPDFGFQAMLEIVTYLGDLGISDLYASPIFRARAGSNHGYDLVDPGELNPELGSSEEFDRLTRAIKDQGMGWLQDIVPNHMAFTAENSYIADILENGPASAYYNYFDIDWEHYYEAIRGKVLAPFLGSYFGQALENGELRLDYDEQGFAVSYHTLSFPLKIESYLDILNAGLPAVRRALGQEHPDYIQLLGILYVLKTLRSDAGDNERMDQVRFIKQNLWTLYLQNLTVKKAMDHAVHTLNGQCGEPESFNRLESLLNNQWFRLAFWKVACEEINYRRFFSINDLISVRVENEEVFNHTHALPLRLLREGHFTGLRIDHIDGLYNPASYLHKLRNRAPESFLVVEKILAAGEPLPAWPISGTTGYDFMNTVNGIFCEVDSAKNFTDIYQRFTGRNQTCAELIYASKKLIIERYMFGDVNNLAHRLKNIASRHRYGSDITMDSLKRALIEILVQFPVYRAYLDSSEIREFDRQSIETAVARARKINPDYLNEFDYICRVLLGQIEPFLPEGYREEWLHFAMCFQQLSGPLMAKGFEDTLLYNYNRLLSLNEVGGDPERFGLALDDFHAFNRLQQANWPHTLNATATHDSKWGEDVRARLNVLSEMPREWAQHVRNWARINRGKKKTVDRRKVPDKNDEYFLYQSLLGAWPLSAEDLPDFLSRLKEFIVKAVREAKARTAWLKPDIEYEDAFLSFIDRILSSSRDNTFIEEFLPFQRKIAFFGMLNSLSQTLIKVTAPGIPDFYQGTEFWQLNFVDPDNRRPVDYIQRMKALQEIRTMASDDLQGLIAELLANMNSGWIKMFLTHKALNTRNRYPALFRVGDYLPLETRGPLSEYVIAFARMCGDEVAITVAPRLLAGWLAEGEQPMGQELWGETSLVIPWGGAIVYRNQLTGGELPAEGELPVGQILDHFPVALLTGRKARIEL
ncbi:MAG: malto-oligosyltrehalose synthase [Desulfuromonadales bacterium]